MARGSHRDVLVCRHRGYGVNVDRGVGIPNHSRHSMVSAGINCKDALFLASVACHGTYAPENPHILDLNGFVIAAHKTFTILIPLETGPLRL
jgi:hypothetical protein